ncbi:MAG: ATP-binding protein [Candidatus Freyarchaeota archaeon]|nr:ATP-binding protein [Candidatus Jordarchaeia archaeon]MBS7268596.1 ATP-binding protein [Candidatus Jordarchaeia archaeon]MBS7279285.1 ATP-binding protein [Candidatus Jordarchaeia archaeon]
MEKKISCIEPVDRELFTGRTPEISLFQDFISRAKTGSEDRRIFVITGIPGIGKSSLLKRFAQIAEKEGIEVLVRRVSAANMRMFFDDVKRTVDSYAPEARKKFMGEKKYVAAPPVSKELGEGELEYFLKQFFEDMDKVQEKLRKILMFFCDDFERFAWLGYETAYRLLRAVAARLGEMKFNLFFVLCVDRRFLEALIGDRPELFHVVELDVFSTQDIRLLIQKYQSLTGIKIDDSLKDELVKASGGIPFKLALLMSGLLRETVKSGSQPSVELFRLVNSRIQDNALNAITDLTVEKETVIERIVSQKFNMVPLEEISQEGDKKTSREALNVLVEEGILEADESTVWLKSEAIYEMLRLLVNVDQIYGRARTLLKVIGRVIETRERLDRIYFEWLRDSANMLISQDKPALALEIAANAEVYAYSTMEKKLYSESFQLFRITASIYERLGDKERAGMILEKAAELFEGKGKRSYSRFLLSHASDLFAASGVEWKARSIARSAALIYEEIGDDYDGMGFKMLARVFYHRAFEHYMRAGDKDRIKRLYEKATNAFTNQPIFLKEFEALNKKVTIKEE